MAKIVQGDAVDVGWGLGSSDGRRVGIYPVVALGGLASCMVTAVRKQPISAEASGRQALETCADIWLSSMETKKKWSGTGTGMQPMQFGKKIPPTGRSAASQKNAKRRRPDQTERHRV